ncbi:Crp/Fnr family transcriptional regulator [Psychroserpens ponticola]|uniref:Crp/Fnr family transcriptional regulator n=1 Tax=Psychroserpens ponticola TaxID=2932268 RepID=A0ABY7RTP0_9FLAO|nr:Crp/Fnr family transcriptional regulator [Psychroserpens ponticola]WCO00488.1 Crp/Fnr family transcriptional regulator [Psychroserpens ponticola]
MEEKSQYFINFINNYVALSEEDKEIILSKVSIRKYLKGQYVVQQGDVCRNSGFIISGCSRTFYVDDNGEEHIVMFSIENWWASEIGSFVSQKPSDYNVQCIEDTELIQLSFEDQEDLFKAVPKLERFFRLILEQAFVASQKRIVSTFSLSAKDQYIQFTKLYPEIEKRIPQYMVASYLGITKEFLSKIKNTNL